MTKKQTTAARKAREQQRVSGQKYTDALREARRETPATVLAHALRDAGLTQQAADLAYYAREAHRRELEWLASDDPNHDPGPDADQFGISFDEQQIESVFTALTAAATGPVPAQLLAAAATVLRSLDPGYAADVIRHQELGPVPAPLETTSAQLACAAAHALAEAATIPFGGDEQWDACMRLWLKAQALARQAADE